MTVSGASQNPLYVALPVSYQALGGTARMASQFASCPVVSVVSGLGWAAFGSIRMAATGIKFTMNTANRYQVIKHCTQLVQEIDAKEMARQEQVRDKKQETITWAAKGAKIATAFIPVVGGVTSVVTDIAQEVTKAEQKFESLNRTSLQYYGGGILNFLRFTAPYLLSGFELAASKVEEVAGYAEKKFRYSMLNPSIIEQSLTDVADRMEAIRWKLVSREEEKHTSEEVRETLGGLTFDEFEKLSNKERRDILFLLEDSNLELQPEEIRLYSRVIKKMELGHELSRKELQARDEIVEYYNHLPLNMRNKLTCSDFEELDTLEKIKSMHLVRRFAKGLTTHESRLLLSYRNVRSRKDWEALSEKSRTFIERLVLSKFNTLKSKEKESLNDISEEQFLELSQDDRKLIAQMIFEKVITFGTEREKKRLEKIVKLDSIDEYRDAWSCLRCFAKYFSGEEKAFLSSSIDKKVVLVAVSSDDIEKEITMLEKERDKAIDAEFTHKINDQIDALKSCQQNLQKASQEVTKTEPLPVTVKKEVTPEIKTETKPIMIQAERPVDMEKIEKMIGPYVVSEGWIYSTFEKGAQGYFVSVTEVQKGLATVFHKLEDSSDPERIKKFANCAAGGIEFVLSIPKYGPGILKYILEKGGVNTALVEQTLATIPTLVRHQGLNASQKFLDFIQEVRGAQKHYENVENIPIMTTEVDKANKVLLERFDQVANEIKSSCPNESAFICNDEVFSVLQSTEKMKEYASKIHVDYHSPQFAEMIRQMTRTGKVVKTAVETAVETAVKEEVCKIDVNFFSPNASVTSTLYQATPATDIAETMANVQEPHLSTLVNEPIDEGWYASLSKTFDKMSASMASRAEETWNTLPSLVKEGANRVAKAVGGAYQNVKETVEEFVQGKATAAKEFLNIEQKAPESVENLQLAAKTLAENRQKLELCRLSNAALNELTGIWGTTAKGLAQGEKYLQGYTYYKDTIRPILGTSLRFFQFQQTVSAALVETGDLLAEGSHRMGAEAGAQQVQAALQSDAALDIFLKMKGEVAEKIGGGGDPTTLQKLWNAAPYATAMCSWLMMGTSASFVCVPLIAKTILPPLLSELGGMVGENARPFWYNLASAVEPGSTKVDDTFLFKLGSYLQATYRISLSHMGIDVFDKKRIDNFYVLSDIERRHLCECLMQCRIMKSSEKEFLLSRYKKFPNIAEKEREKLIKLVLHSFDRLSPSEKLAISPTYFVALDARVQNRVLEILARFDGVSYDKITDSELIVKRFNKLPKEVKEKIDEIDYSEFLQYSDQDQEDILFIATHSKGFKYYSDKDPARIVDNFNELPEEVRAPYQQLTQESFTKLLKEEQEEIRFRIAKNVEFLESSAGLPDLTLALKYEARRDYLQSLDTDWSLKKFAKDKSAEQIRTLLAIYSRMPQQERCLLTPSRLKLMGQAKIDHARQIIDKYHPQWLEELKKVKEDKQTAVIASLFNELEPWRKKEFTNVTEEELLALPKEEAATLLRFLIGFDIGFDFENKTLTHALERIEKGAPYDSGFIVTCFNNLPDQEKARWRETQSLDLAQKNIITKHVEDKLKVIEQKISFVEKRITKISDKEIVALQLKMERAKAEGKSLGELQAKLGSQKNKIAGLIDYKARLAEELYGLNRFLGRSYMEETYIPAESPQVIQIIDDAIALAITEVHKQFETAGASVIQNTKAEKRQEKIETIRELYTEKLKQTQEKIVEVQKLKERYKEEIFEAEKIFDTETAINKRLELRALHHFRLKVLTESEKATKKLLDDFDTKCKEIIENDQKAAALAAEQKPRVDVEPPVVKPAVTPKEAIEPTTESFFTRFFGGFVSKIVRPIKAFFSWIKNLFTK